MVWCQGCTDGDLHTPKDVYKADTERVLHSFMQDAGAQTCFLIQIGNQRDEPELYLPMQQAQEELASEQGDIVLVSRQFKTFAAKGLMKDRFHYLQPAYNEVGDGSRHAAWPPIGIADKIRKNPTAKRLGYFFTFTQCQSSCADTAHRRCRRAE